MSRGDARGVVRGAGAPTDHRHAARAEATTLETSSEPADDDDDDSLIPESLRTARFVRSGIYEAADWYDVDYAGYRAEEAFYRLVLQRHVRAGGVVVELGVGTGRLALRFVAEGFRVHGVEPAAGMRAVLERKLRDVGGAPGAFHIEAGDARSFVGPAGRVDVIMFPFNGIFHLRTRDELVSSFRHVHERLAPDGRFALDCTGPYWGVMLSGRVPWGRSDERVHPGSGRRVLTCDRSRYDRRTRQVTIDIRYLLDGERAGVEVELEQTMWTWQQVLAALDEAGFEPEVVFGDVDLAPFHEGAPRLLVGARKAGAT